MPQDSPLLSICVWVQCCSFQRSKFTYGSVTCTSALETATTTACMVDLPPSLVLDVCLPWLVTLFYLPESLSPEVSVSLLKNPLSVIIQTLPPHTYWCHCREKWLSLASAIPVGVLWCPLTITVSGSWLDREHNGPFSTVLVLSVIFTAS